VGTPRRPARARYTGRASPSATPAFLSIGVIGRPHGPSSSPHSDSGDASTDGSRSGVEETGPRVWSSSPSRRRLVEAAGAHDLVESDPGQGIDLPHSMSSGRMLCLEGTADVPSRIRSATASAYGVQADPHLRRTTRTETARIVNGTRARGRRSPFRGGAAGRRARDHSRRASRSDVAVLDMMMREMTGGSPSRAREAGSTAPSRSWSDAAPTSIGAAAASQWRVPSRRSSQAAKDFFYQAIQHAETCQLRPRRAGPREERSTAVTDGNGRGGIADPAAERQTP